MSSRLVFLRNYRFLSQFKRSLTKCINVVLILVSFWISLDPLFTTKFSKRLTQHFQTSLACPVRLLYRKRCNVSDMFHFYAEIFKIRPTRPYSSTNSYSYQFTSSPINVVYSPGVLRTTTLYYWRSSQRKIEYAYYDTGGTTVPKEMRNARHGNGSANKYLTYMDKYAVERPPLTN